MWPARDGVDPAAMVRQLGTVGLAALVGVVVTVVIFLIAARDSQGWARHSREVLRTARMAMADATDEQAAIRGFALTRDTAFVMSAFRARERLPAMLDSLVMLTADNPAQYARARELRARVHRWKRGFAAPLLQGPDAAPATTAAFHTDRRLFESVREAYRGFVLAEDALYRERTRSSDVIQLGMVGAISAELLLLALAITRLSRRTERGLHQLAEQQTTLEEQAVELEMKIDEASSLTDDLTAANQELLAALVSRDRAEGAARDAGLRLQAVLEAAPLGVAITDPEGRVVSANPAFVRMAGADASALIGQPLGKAMPPELAAVAEFAGRAIALREPTVHREVTSPIGHRGESRHWLCSVTPIADARGAVSGAGVVLLETTETHNLEQRLRQSQKMEAVGQLAGGVAHDFNNMLTVILSYAALVRGQLAGDRSTREAIDEIARAGNRAAELTRQLLTFSRRKVVHPEHVRLNDIIADTDNMLRRLLPADIEVVRELHADDVVVLADPGQLEQVLVNLVVNARDAMPGGGVLRIRTEPIVLRRARTDLTSGDSAPPGRYAVLTVADNGVGMDAATQARIFEPFFTTKEAGRGTGLGLATVFGIVQQAGGHIWVYSEPGRGTAFKIFLPVATTAVDGETPALRAAPLATSPGELVLLADDADDVRTVTRLILESGGYRVVEARNGEEALAILRDPAQRIDLVVTDVVMPQVGGIELAAEARRVHPALRVLFMSGYSQLSVEHMHRLTDAGDFLEKPFTPDQLLETVQGVLRGVRRQA